MACFLNMKKNQVCTDFSLCQFPLSLFVFLYIICSKKEKKERKKEKVNFKIYDVTAWLTNIDNTHIAQCLMKLATWCCINRLTLNYQRCMMRWCCTDTLTFQWHIEVALTCCRCTTLTFQERIDVVFKCCCCSRRVVFMTYWGCIVTSVSMALHLHR